MKDKIKVISNSDGRCGIDNYQLRLTRRWENRGAAQYIDKDTLEELMATDVSFINLVKDGILFIDDMEFKKSIGLEPEDAKEPTLILMDDKEMNRLWKVIPFAQFKVEIKKLTHEQLVYLAEYAIQHGSDGSMDKIDYLSNASGYNIMKGIELDKANREEVKEVK